MKNDENKFTIIDEGFIVEGTVVGKGRLVIKGVVKGTVNGDDVVISREGAVYAKTQAQVMTIGGVFEGQIEVDRGVTVLSTGRCSGELKCKDLVVEAGGVLNASVACAAVGR